MNKAQNSIKHDVAFSFLSKDLVLATRFADALAPLTSFVYTRKQEDLAGTDGQESLRAAFVFDSRLNVILLGADWGQTPWTRVEEAAIQERCLKEGWGQLLVVNLDGSKPPRWIPEVIFHLDLQAFPFEQAVGAIKRQAQQLGGEIRPQSQADIARAKLLSADFDRQTNVVFRTPEGIAQADEAILRITAHLQTEFQRISDELNRGWKIACGWENSVYGVLRVQACSALFNWERYLNSCHDCDLTIRVFASSFETPEERHAGKFFHRFEEHRKYQGKFKVTRHPALGVAWKHGSRVMASEEVAGEILSHMIDVLAR